ncbi:MAG: amidohydrolase family protein [Neomegalonema sp.]|nr:amidohydrolase family protein [Neomegalonema sp.]
MRIDAHQHFWRLDRGDYGWLTPELEPIYRDFDPDDLISELDEAGMEGTVLIQAAPTVAETEYMLSLAAQEEFIQGVVGWTEFESPEAPEAISWLAQNPALVGLRPMIQDIPDEDWMLRPELRPAFEAMIAADLTFDALTLPRHLPNLRTLLSAHPDLRVVIDHGSKPEIRSGEFDGWAADMTALGRETSAFCKLSGLVTEADAAWDAADLKPYVEHLLAVFGSERLIWGSDWPVCLLASSYARWFETSMELLEGAGADLDAVFGLNAIRAYQLGEDRGEAVI